MFGPGSWENWNCSQDFDKYADEVMQDDPKAVES